MIKILHGKNKDKEYPFFAKIVNIASPIVIEGASEVLCLEKACRRVVNKTVKIKLFRV